MQHQILWIEGRRVKTPSFVSELRARAYQVAVVPTGAAALKQIRLRVPAITVLNAASLGTSGERILDAVRNQLGLRPIILIQNGHSDKQRQSADAVLLLPFTIRKLENRLRRLLPCEGQRMLRAGRLTLDLEGLTVQTGQQVPAHLTPLSAAVLQELMVHAGEVVPRERLFRKVWQTDYTEDTRSLDVHISWLRKAVEKNPGKPRFIRTVRGVGYRLDVLSQKH